MSDLQMPTVKIDLHHTGVGAMFQEGGRLWAGLNQFPK